MGIFLTHMVTIWNWHCTHFPLAHLPSKDKLVEVPVSVLPILPSDNLAGKSRIQPWHQAIISHHISPGWQQRIYDDYEGIQIPFEMVLQTLLPKAYLFLPSLKQLAQRPLGQVFKGGSSLQKEALWDLQQRISQDQQRLAELGGLENWKKEIKN